MQSDHGEKAIICNGPYGSGSRSWGSVTALGIWGFLVCFLRPQNSRLFSTLLGVYLLIQETVNKLKCGIVSMT